MYAAEELIGYKIDRPQSPEIDLWFQEEIGKALYVLLSTKGLYQKVNIDLTSLDRFSVNSDKYKDSKITKDMFVKEFISRPWYLISREIMPGTSAGGFRGQFQDQNTPLFKRFVNLYIPDSETYCNNCKKSTAHTSRYNSNTLYFDELNKNSEKLIQIFVLPFICSICRQQIITNLVKRVGERITLCGRSERLRIEVRKCIPNGFQEILSDSLSAVNENDLYAGFYHMRTFIEHYIKDVLRKPVDEKINGEDLCKDYNSNLEKRMLQGIPSLTTLYDKLSNLMHARKGTIDDYQNLLDDLYGHFEAKTLFEKYKVDK